MVERIDGLARTNDGDQDRAKKMKEFCAKFVEVAFRRPLGEGERALFVDAVFDGAKSPELGVKRCVMFCLKSPRFLYPDLTGAGEVPDGYAVASRLSFALWDSIPDEALLEAAKSGGLGTRGGGGPGAADAE